MPPGVVMALTALTVAGVSVLAANDWTKPCHNGECYYDIPGNERSMAATVRIAGSPSAISDITNAAGWEILDCSPTDSGHNVRLVCLDDDDSCSHIFQEGVEHKIVRLPEHCGNGPFAHILEGKVSEDQSIPLHVRARMKKRHGEWPAVHMLSLDTNFEQASESSNYGNVSIFVYASTTMSTLPQHQARDLHIRTAEEMASNAEELDIFSSFLPSSSSGLGPFVRNTTKNSIPISVNQQFNVFNSSLPCTGDTDAELSIDGEVDLQGEIDLGVIAQGTIIPPRFDQFGLFATMSADLAGKLSISSDISGEVESPEIPILSIGLPGFSVPEVISVGPSVSISAKATANVDVNLNMGIGIGYGFSNLTVFFPPTRSHNSSVVIATKDIPFELSVSPGVKSSTSFAAHLIPSLNLGLVAFNVKTAAFLNFDTSAMLGLNLNAEADASVDASGATNTSTAVDGCVDVKGGVSVNVGLEANSPLFDLLGNSASITLAEKELQFFNQCFSDSSRSSDVASAPGSSAILKKAELSCLPDSAAVLGTVVNQTLSQASFKGT